MMDEKKRDNGPKIAIGIVAIVAIVVLILFLIYAYSVGLTASFM